MQVNTYLGYRLILLRHKHVDGRCRGGIVCAQYEHRCSAWASARAMRRRKVAIECGTWRSVRRGAAAVSVKPSAGSALLLDKEYGKSPPMTQCFAR